MLSLVEYAYNNSYHSSISMTPLEVLYGRRFRSPIGCFEVGEFARIGLEAIYEIVENV